MLRILAQVPSSIHLIDRSQELNESYYLRHRVETIKRIRLTSQTDALALASMVEEDYEAARWWSRYTHEELNHDLLYLKDLEKHGYRLEEVMLIPPFPSTIAMVEYIRSKILEVGSLAAVTYSIWVEWNSERASRMVVDRAEKKFSSMHIKGSRAHTRFDEESHHYQLMLDVAHRLMLRREDQDVIFAMLHSISDYIAMYFKELDDAAGSLRPVRDGLLSAHV